MAKLVILAVFLLGVLESGVAQDGGEAAPVAVADPAPPAPDPAGPPMVGNAAPDAGAPPPPAPDAAGPPMVGNPAPEGEAPPALDAPPVVQNPSPDYAAPAPADPVVQQETPPDPAPAPAPEPAPAPAVADAAPAAAAGDPLIPPGTPSTVKCKMDMNSVMDFYIEGYTDEEMWDNTGPGCQKACEYYNPADGSCGSYLFVISNPNNLKACVLFNCGWSKDLLPINFASMAPAASA